MDLPGRWTSLFLPWLAAVAYAQAPVNIPVPTSRQIAWQSLEYSAFIHFGLNTYTDREWGYGDESPALFNPAEFDADRIVRLLRDAGMSSVIITAKHHDGFCLWPSAATDHSVKHSPWKNGTGDVVQELADACRRHGLKFGVYLSPWDRNHKDYGRPGYLTYYRTQLRELLNNYGEISEVWFDGANGGDGYYGGARETRTIDRRTYYDWPATWALVREWQPQAAIFSDVGPDIRWVGNELGYAGETCWSTFSPVGVDGGLPSPGTTRYLDGVEGHRDGASWMPAECDVSIRPGWFYHAGEDSLVKSPAELLKLYLRSVGRNATLLLNVPLDRRGLVATADSVSLTGFRRLREELFAGAIMLALTPEPGVQGAWTATPPRPARFNGLELGEEVGQGQRVASFRVEAFVEGGWRPIAAGTTIGRRRILLLSATTAGSVRVVVTDSLAPPRLRPIRLLSIPPGVASMLAGER